MNDLKISDAAREAARLEFNLFRDDRIDIDRGHYVQLAINTAVAEAKKEAYEKAANDGYAEVTKLLNPQSASVGTTVAYGIASKFRAAILALIKPN